MSNFKISKRSTPKLSKGRPDCSEWNINNRQDAQDQIDYLIELTKKHPSDKVEIFLNDKLQYSQNVKREPYILECPWCVQKHQIDTNGEFLLNHPDRMFALKCADSFSDAGCKRTIVMCSLETINKLQKS